MSLVTLVVSTVLLQAPSLPLTPSPTRPLGTLRQQAAVEQEWLRFRLDSVLPRLMRQYHVAMWVVPMREYNEDPVFWSLVSATTFFARRRTIYVFYDRGPERGVERLALGGTSQGGVYDAYHAKEAIDPSIGRRPELGGQAQWDLLRRVIEERDPASIAVDISRAHACSDGLSAGEWEQLQGVLPAAYRARCGRGRRPEARPGAAPIRRRTARPSRRAHGRCRRRCSPGRALRSRDAADPTAPGPPARGAGRSTDRWPPSRGRRRTHRPGRCRPGRAAPRRARARDRKTRRSCGAARRTSWPTRATRTRGLRCIPASAPPTWRRDTAASAGEAPSRGESAATPARPRPAGAACPAGGSAKG